MTNQAEGAAEPKNVLEMCRLTHQQKRAQACSDAPRETSSGCDDEKKHPEGEFIG